MFFGILKLAVVGHPARSMTSTACAALFNMAADLVHRALRGLSVAKGQTQSGTGAAPGKLRQADMHSFSADGPPAENRFLS